MTRKAIIIGVVWFICWSVTWPALLADLQAKNFRYTDYDTLYAQKYYRDDLGAAMGFALLPPIWIIAPFATGFYEHGFQIRRRQPGEKW